MAQDFTVDRASKKYVLGSDGFLKEYANDEAAIEFNADGSYKGVLVEPQSINLCLQSEDINTTWAAGADAAPAQSTETTPDGDSTNKYIKLVDDGSGGTGGGVSVIQTITVSASTKYTASVFLKADGINFARIRAVGIDVATNGEAFFELTGTGDIGTASNLDDSKIEAYPNGWYRCSITWTQGASDTSFIIAINVANSLTNASVPLDGTSSIFVWGAQIEASPIATSYIPTTTGAVTRVKDDIYLTSASSLIGQTEGTLFVDVDWQLASGKIQNIFAVSDGTFSNGFRIYNSSAGSLTMLGRSNDVTLTNQGESSTAYTGIQKFAFAYKTDDFELYRNGSSISTDTSGSLSSLATLTDIDFGQGSGDSPDQANMWIRSVALYKTRLTDTQCQDLTTL